MSLKSVLEKHGIACAFGSEIEFKNGSTIKISGCSNNVRGHRGKYIEPFWGDEPYVDTDMIKEVIEEFMNKERLTELPSDSDIYLSSEKWLKENDK